MKNPIIILGPGRSGSKLVQNILNNDDKIFIAPEMNFYSRFKPSILTLFRKYQKQEEPFDFSSFYKELNNKNYGKAYSFIKDFDIKSLEKNLQKTNISEKVLFESFLFERKKVTKPNAIHIGAKFPFHFSFIDKFIDWYPNCRIVFLVRDPRAVLASEI